jgi:hypothetical protein
MYITFKIAHYQTEVLLGVMPVPSGMIRQGSDILICYAFEKKNLNGKQILRIGLIKKSIENLLQGDVTWQGEAILGNGPIYNVDNFYRKYTLYKKWPRWVWPKHRKYLMQNGMRYAQRLYEKDLFCFEMVLGAMYLMNQRMDSKITDYKLLEGKARWVTAKTHERINKGDFERLSGEALSDARSEAGKAGNEKSQKSRKTKANIRREEIQLLLNKGVSDPHAIASRLSVNVSTIYRDLKAIKTE